VDGRPFSVFTVETMNGRIQSIYIVTNPEKLAHLPPPPS
jgi:RNA polymerase sigma-70 factor, ECF subfamily